MPVSLAVLPKDMPVSVGKVNSVVLWSLHELRSEVHNIYLELRIIQIQLGSDTGFDQHPGWHVIIQEREGVPEKACTLSLISGWLMRPAADTAQSVEFLSVS